MTFDSIISMPAYDLNKEDKGVFFNQYLRALFVHHYQHCPDYRAIMDSLYPETTQNILQPSDNTFTSALIQVPALAVRLFKHHLLKSVSEDNIFKMLTSSGTSSAQLSKIVLDKENSIRQQKVLSNIMKNWLGEKRLPMLIIDHANVIKNKYDYSARGAGIQGLSIFGHHHCYALNEDMTLNLPAINTFIAKYKNEKVFIFGFTYMIWQHFVKALQVKAENLTLSNALILHSGGWKKLENQAVSNKAFNQQLTMALTGKVKADKINIHNFYGMAEQTGSIYVECEQGFMHASVFSDIVIKNPNTLAELPLGEEGLIQTYSLLPTSYPGHALLTEDLGILHGVDNCQCGRKGKYFTVTGRLAKAEVRGCSDTQA